MPPVVSCICPTANRRSMIPQMIASYQSQTWPARELVILDDGEDGVADLLPVDDDTIEYYRIDPENPLNIPAKRNLCVSLAKGEYVAHFDDDDWSAPGRLESQMELFDTHGVGLVGYHSILFWWPEKNEGWRYKGSHSYICGTSMVYTKDFWQTKPFPESFALGSDNEVVYAAARAKVSASQDGGLNLVARLHDKQSQNTRNSIGSGSWDPVPKEEFPADFFSA